MNNCSNCRWFDGKKCILLNSNRSPTNPSCSKFANYRGASSKNCSNCRWFNGKKCELLNSNRSATNPSCSKFAPHR